MIYRTLTFDSLKYSLCTISLGNGYYNILSFHTGKKNKTYNLVNDRSFGRFSCK
jgi:hypothetical protein